MAQQREFNREFQDDDLQLQCVISGYCPVQAEGTVAGNQLYFRARWDEWSFSVSESAEVDPVDIQLPGQGFLREGEHDEASWMAYDDAEAIIRRCAREFLASKAA